MSKVTLTQHEYEKMQRQIAKLNALEAGGVDDWQWYEESLKEWRKDGALLELADAFVDDMNELSISAEVDFPAGREAGASVCMPQTEMRNLFLKYIDEYEKIKGEN